MRHSRGGDGNPRGRVEVKKQQTPKQLFRNKSTNRVAFYGIFFKVKAVNTKRPNVLLCCRTFIVSCIFFGAC